MQDIVSHMRWASTLSTLRTPTALGVEGRVCVCGGGATPATLRIPTARGGTVQSSTETKHRTIASIASAASAAPAPPCAGCSTTALCLVPSESIPIIVVLSLVNVTNACASPLLSAGFLQCIDIVYGSNGKSSGRPRGMPLVTRIFASNEHAWDPMASSSANSCRKTNTVP
jgi:hypothetical protein